MQLIRSTTAKPPPRNRVQIDRQAVAVQVHIPHQVQAVRQAAVAVHQVVAVAQARLRKSKIVAIVKEQVRHRPTVPDVMGKAKKKQLAFNAAAMVISTPKAIYAINVKGQKKLPLIVKVTVAKTGRVYLLVPCVTEQGKGNHKTGQAVSHFFTTFAIQKN